MKVLVREKIADSGVELLRANFDVDLGLEMSDGELRDAIAGYDAILIRSATKMTPELIERASNARSFWMNARKEFNSPSLKSKLSSRLFESVFRAQCTVVDLPSSTGTAT